MSFLGDLMNGEQKQAPASPAPYIPTPSNATILTEGTDKTPSLIEKKPDHLKLNDPGKMMHVGIRG